MNITEQLLKADPSLERHIEGFWDKPYNPPNGHLPSFSSFNDAGIECETGEFLYALVRLLKPYNILETGTHWGIGASYMGMAVKENKMGHLDTLEFLPEIHARAVERLSVLKLQDVVTAHLVDARAFEPQVSYKLILLDTEPGTRFSELIRYFDSLEEGGFVFIHDLHRHMHQIPNEEHGFAWPYGVLPEEIKDLVKSDKLRPFHFSTPRGLTGFYKPSKEDYKW